ncbi:DUF3667 domain-containing protein [Polaribacter sp. Asnod1-A03]|uniref:DUF3667 domain-containing protein n=1 Tax=Polaribacter sp. Asnod1-A03 TaxID=3160581 RepID=UPI00386D701D
MIKLRKAKNKKLIIKDPECLNCGHPFSGHEKFCPDCGQENKGNRIPFANFVQELFSGLFSFDAKFWKTIIPLLIKPGKVSRDYIDGKRQRYTNPFRFYLMASIIFFLIIGLSKNLDKFNELKNGNLKTSTKNLVTFDGNEKTESIDLDSLRTAINNDLKNAWIPIDSIKRKQIADAAVEDAKDSTKTVSKNSIGFSGLKIDDYIRFQKKHPTLEIDSALDSLSLEKTFINRFLYSRAKVVNSFIDQQDSQEQFLNQMLSYGSIALFIFLPFFTLFLKLFYIRKKYTYVDHLIFVFHTQTVFFMLISIYFLLDIFGLNPKSWLFTILFLIYLFIAMKNFYRQGFFKTFIKFLFLNLNYMIISCFGITIVALISFVLF